MTVLEKDIERKLVQMVSRHGGYCLKWVCPGQSGVPDRIVLLPCGRVFFVETKRPSGSRISQLQFWVARRLHQLGFQHYFVSNVEELEAFGRLLGD